MAHGVKLTPEQEECIRLHYCMTGSASAGADEAECSERAARGLIARWRAEDPEGFAERCRATRARMRAYLEDGIQAAADKALARHNDEAFEFVGPDPRPQYLRAVIDWHKAIVAADRLDAERTGEIAGREVVIQIAGPDEPDGNPAQG